MKLVLDNPFRQFGLLANASALDSNRQVRRTNQYIEAGQEPDEAFSFYSLGEINRSTGSLQSAKQELDLDKSKLEWALFWFVKLNDTFDVSALEALKKGAFSTAESTWRLQISDANDTVNEWNYSAYLNLSTYYLSQCMNGGSLNMSQLHSALQMKIQLLESNYADNLKNSICDSTHSFDPKSFVVYVARAVNQELIRSKLVSKDQFIRLINNLDFKSKDNVIQELAHSLVEEIKDSINRSKAVRKQAAAKAYQHGKKLYNSIRPTLNTLSQSLGQDSQIYISIADKASEEILQSGIDYFNHLKDTETDPSKESLELVDLARSLAKGKILIQRCAENQKNIDEWVDDKPNRDSIKPIKSQIESLITILSFYDGRQNTADNSQKLLDEAMPFLNEMRSIVGSSNDIYLQMSTTIAGIVLGMCVSNVNSLLSKVNSPFEAWMRDYNIQNLKDVVRTCDTVFKKMDNMHLKSDFIRRFNTEKNTLKENARALGIREAVNHSPTYTSNSNRATTNNANNNITRSTTQSSRVQTSSNSNCYIATMAYGDINHPQVCQLRQYRDSVLTQYAAGRFGIWLYYKLSPHLVELLKDIKWIHRIVRQLLDRLISRIQL